jgi:DNA-binding transcriptional LysR family regulator
MERQMDWDDLQTFLVIAREGSLSAAAKALNTTQPTMGRRLTKLEQKVGARLLERHPRGFALTSLGEQVLGNAERIEAEVIATERVIKGRDIALEGIVKVTAVDVVASRIIIPAIATLQCTHPNIVVALIPDARLLSLSRREADIAVRFTRFENMDLVTKKIGIMTAGFYVSQKYIDKHGHPKNSVEHKIIQVLEDQTHLEEAQALQQQFPNAKISLRTNSREAMIMGCKQGIGIACLPKFRAEIEDDLLELTEISVLPRRDVWLGVHSDLRHMPRIRAVIDAISEAFAGFK